MPEKFMHKSCVFFVILMLWTPMLFAQRTGDLGVFGGVSYYMGDLNPQKLFLMPRPAYGALYRFNINHRMAIQGHYLHGKIEASDAKSK